MKRFIADLGKTASAVIVAVVVLFGIGIAAGYVSPPPVLVQRTGMAASTDAVAGLPDENTSRVSSSLDIRGNTSGAAAFNMSVKYTNGSTAEIGPFTLRYVNTTVLEAQRTMSFNDVVIGLPAGFVNAHAVEKDVSVQVKRRARLTADPTFYRGTDFDASWPFSEIEVTVASVTIYEDTGEAFYDTYVRIEENETDASLESLQIVVGGAGY